MNKANTMIVATLVVAAIAVLGVVGLTTVIMNSATPAHAKACNAWFSGANTGSCVSTPAGDSGTFNSNTHFNVKGGPK